MKITGLTVAGFGPFKTEQRVDFAGFDDDGIFLITGRTGSGKSSILDAICYALYGSVPRYENAQQSLRSDHCEPTDPTFTELEFVVAGHRYRVRRSPEYERPKRGGRAGTTMSAASAHLFRWQDDEWIGIAARPVDVGPAVIALVGLTKDQFLQVVLLAQNRFQQFLRAGNDDRQSVLRSLFATARFLRYETTIAEERDTLRARVSGATETVAAQTSELLRVLGESIGRGEDATAGHGADATIGLATAPVTSDPDWFDRAGEQLVREHSQAAALSERADEQLQAADDDYRRQLRLRELRLRRRGALDSLATLARLAPAIDDERVVVESARRATAVWPLLRAQQDARSALDRATLDSAGIRRAFDECDQRGIGGVRAGAEEADPALGLAHRIEEVSRQLGALELALADESNLPLLRSGTEEAGRQLVAAEQRVELAVEALRTKPEEIRRLGETVESTRLAAATRAAAQTAAVTASQAVEASVRGEELGRRLDAAQLTELSATTAQVEAATLHQSLMERRLAGHAAELAATLTDGLPCHVCGSTEHPRPAEQVTDPVVQADIDRARDQLEQRRHEMDAATAARVAVRVELAAAEARTGGRESAVLRDELSIAEGALRLATDAADQVTSLEVALRAEIEALDHARTELTDLNSAVRDRASALAEQHALVAAADLRRETQRGEFDSVAERAATLRLWVEHAQGLRASFALVSESENACATADRAVAVQVELQGFDSADAARAARLDAAAINGIDLRIAAHDQAIASAVSVLAEPELRGLIPTGDAAAEDDSDDVDSQAAAVQRDERERADLIATERALAAARSQRDNTLTQLARKGELLNDGTRIIGIAQAALEASASLQQQYSVIDGLASALQGKEPNTRRMRLETYVLAAQLEQIVAAANTRLKVMTHGRFTLQHDDSVQYRNTRSGLGLSILDEHTGRSRATNSLSGGETFLASLALALGLAEVVTSQAGGIRLDTLFIDEGFGSLDSETLEIAMSTLDGLRAGGRTIGLISHVGSMKEQIGATLDVTVTPRGDSVIDQVAPSAG